MKFKRLMILGLASLVLFTSIPIVNPPINVEAASDYILSGNCGGVSYTLSQGGTLTLTGDGYEWYKSTPPWGNYKSQITSVVINGPTKIPEFEGYTGDIYCVDCKVLLTRGEVLSATGKHTYDSNGSCTGCGEKHSDISTPPIQETPNTQTTPNKSDTSNKVEPPRVEIPTVETYEGKSAVAEAKAIKANVSKLSNKKGKKVEIKLTKKKGYKYEIQVSTSKKFNKSVKKYTTSKTTYTVKKLSKNKKYYVRVRTFKVINGTKVYGKWSKVKSIKIKK